MEESKRGKIIKSAFDSTYFERNVEIRVDRKVGSATISPCGRDIALASSNGLDIIDLDNPLNPPRHLSHPMSGLVSDVQWSPFAVRDYWIASTANQKALVWNLHKEEGNIQGSIEHTLHGHSRAITDLNFSAHHPDMLATCAVDGYVHCWDLRRPRQPALTFCDWFAGATQVKYNRQDSHILASSHDRWLRIWDDRKGAAPLRSINAHESKIYGVDWNRTRATGIITCSLDKSIKFWDYGNDLDEPERIIRTDFPVWRARHTPFGWGVLAMPQDTPGNLHLYERRLQGGMERDCHAPAITTFAGHGDHKVKEFLWRPRGDITDAGVDNREFQLVTWGEDNCLRLHHVNSDSLAGVGHIQGSQVRKKLNVTRKGAVYKTFRTVEKKSSDKKLPTISGPRPGSSGLSALTMGQGRTNFPYLSHCGVIRAPTMKGKPKNAKHDDQSQSQIEWMSGIKILKQDPQAALKRPNSRRLSLLALDFNEDWDTSESLHDEIIRIHDQLPKIKFNDVDMDKRTIKASMNGPWGDDGTPIHIAVTIVFPEQYPESKAPTFSLGKSSLLQDEIHNKLSREVQQIASGFVARKQGCLEATLCYLLGEVDLETSTTFYKHDDDLDALADESSSDDDGADIPISASLILSQELDSSAAESMLTPGNRNANVPLPRLCGARFSANGKLVCFFPPKEDKVKSLLESLVSKNNARVRGEPVFANFGRLHNNSSPIPRLKTMSMASESRTDSDASDVSDYSSSTDSDSTQFPPRFQMSAYFRKDRRPFKKHTPTLLSQRSSAGGTGTGTGSGMGRFRPSRPKNVVTLHHIAAMLPSKVELADDYAVFGDGPDVCEHNARVAEKHGYSDIADVWRYAAILLNNEIPLEVLNQSRRNEPVFIIAKDALKRKRSGSGSDSGSDSGLDVTFDLQGKSQSISGRVKWGRSPLAKQLIVDLFAHFEATADIQMLAMLSCVFNEPLAEDAALQVDAAMTQPQTPISMKTPAFSLDYFPTDAAAWNMYRKTPISSVVSTPRFSQTPTGYFGSVGSSNTGAWGSDPIATSYSCGETPPLRSGGGSTEHLARQTQSLSTCPDNSRSFRRANSGLASSFAASFSRPFTMASSSPPNPLNRKRPSPVENILSSLAPSAITWGSTTVLGSVKEQTPIERFSYSDDEHSKSAWNPTVCTGITLTLQNQNSFDDEGCMSTPLLETSQAILYASYRRAYAELLYLWRQPLSRLEILKFNGLTEYFHGWDETDTKSFAASIKSNDTFDTAREDAPPSPILLGKIRPKPTSHIEEGLDVAGFCLRHESRLEPHISNTSGGAVGRCDRCRVIQRQLRCVICLEPVSDHFEPCLSCGCVTHEHCLAEYYKDEDESCPGGCDCQCTFSASKGLVETWAVMTGVIEDMRRREEKNGVKIIEDTEFIDEWDEKTDWEHLSPPPTREWMKPHNPLKKHFSRARSEWGISGKKKKPKRLRNYGIK